MLVCPVYVGDYSCLTTFTWVNAAFTWVNSDRIAAFTWANTLWAPRGHGAIPRDPKGMTSVTMDSLAFRFFSVATSLLKLRFPFPR